MVGIVVVSHSSALADGVVELARQMGGEEVKVEPAGGAGDGVIGTDAERVREAIARAMSDDGVLVLMDLGSALMSAEMAVELLEGDGRVVLSEAPLVEGAVAAAASARTGAALDEVSAEAKGALAMKVSQLGGNEDAAAGAEGEPPRAGAADAVDQDEVRLVVANELGLHARPAALVVEIAARFDADLRLAKAGGRGPVSARSLTGLMTLGVRKGDELVARASGPQADDALRALTALVRNGFGEDGHAVQRAPGGARAHPETSTRDEPLRPGARLRAIPASSGIALGPLRHLEQPLEAPARRRPAGSPEQEWGRLEQALASVREATERNREGLVQRGAVAEADIFSAQVALLRDESLLEQAKDAIGGGESAETAWFQASEESAAALRALDDALLRERAVDVEDIARQVLAVLAGEDPRPRLSEEGILAVTELTPAQAAAIDPGLVRGIATARGTPTSHAAIIARGLSVPAVVGLGAALVGIPEGTAVVLDGEAGTLEVSPGEESQAAARDKMDRIATRRRAASQRAAEPALTRDGTRIEVSANLGAVEDARRAVEMGADGVGLLRTEFLFLERAEMPTEDEQADALREICAVLGHRPVVVRTLDVGADKPLPALPLEPEANPFLGRRGLRLSLAQPNVFATQLRAIVRVAADYPLKVMFPMVTTAAELDAGLAAVRDAQAATGADGSLEVGIMVEVPAAALLADRLAEQAQFFSIGTNDLAQYTMAAERGNERVGDLLAGLQPAVLALVKSTVEGARARRRHVAVCGELAGDPAAAVLLIGLGVTELSMAAPLIPEIKETLRAVSMEQASAAADRALDAPDASGARAIATDLL